MDIQLVGITKPTKKNEGYPLYIDYDKINEELEDDKDKDKTIKALKRFSQNFARVCYSKYDWNDLAKEEYKEDLIDGRVIPSKHHSVFEHVNFNFYMSKIPKIGAMILNNEKQYVTSEKSARYTKMKDMSPEQQELYDKWMDILIPEIDKQYPRISDKKRRDMKVKKLAQENARYMTSVMTPTNMGYSVNLRQLNFLINEFEKGEIPHCSKDLEGRVVPYLKDFASQLDSLKIEGLEHKPDKRLSLFNNREAEEHFGDVYSTSYLESFAGLAQAQRHRTINYHVSEGSEKGAPLGFFVPDIVKYSDKEKEWVKDLEKVAEYDFPQAQNLKVNERGIIEDFRLKTTERICGHAQYEIMKKTIETTEKYDQYQREFGKNYNKPKCIDNPKNCNGACDWGGKRAVKRLF